MMKIFISRSFVLILLATIAFPAFAQKGWRLFPGTEEDFAHKPTLSLLGGVLSNNEAINDTNTLYGVELSFMCPLIQSPNNTLRQQVSYVYSKKDEDTFQTVEANVHYLFDMTNDFKLGVGPGVGYVRAEVSHKTSPMLAVQLGGSAHYYFEKFFVGAEFRYQITQRAHVGKGSDNGADNWRGLLKVGYSF